MASIPEPTTTVLSSQPSRLATDANACEIEKLAEENGMEVFHPAIGIFNDLRERITMTGPFLKAALLDVRKVIKLLETIKGNQHIYAAFVEEALQIFQRVDKAAEIVDRPIRPGTAAAIVVEGVLQNAITVRNKIEQYAQLPPSEQFLRRDETEASVKDHTAELNRSLAVLTVHTISALASDHDWSKSISTLSLVEKPGVTVRIEGPERFKSTKSEHSPEELLKKVVHQALQHASMAVDTKTESLNASDDSEPAEGGANPPVTADDPQTVLSRQQSVTTHQAERLRKYRQALQEVFSPVGSKDAEDILPDDGKPDSSVDPVGSGSKVLITIYTQLCALSGDQVLQYLYKLASNLEDLDLVEQAIPVLHIVTMLSRRKIDDNPKKDGPDRINLARSLLHLSSILLSMARMDEALVASEEAIVIIKGSCVRKPNAHNAHLAVALELAAICQTEIKDNDKAIENSAQVLELYRTLHGQRPDSFKAQLAISLRNYAYYLNKGARSQDATEAIEECLVMYRSLHSEQPEEFRRRLATTLGIYSTLLGKANRNEEAQISIKECLELRQSLYDAQPTAVETKVDLARALETYSVQLGKAKRSTDALKRIEEALAIRRSLHRSQPDVFSGDLARSLFTYSDQLRTAGRHRHALTVIEECLAIYADISRAHPAKYRFELKNARWLQSRLLKRSETRERTGMADREGSWRR